MRILERCFRVANIPEIRQQIESLLEAFSADTTQPFELKVNVLYGTPKKSSEEGTPTEATFAREVTASTNKLGRSGYACLQPTSGLPAMMNHTSTAHPVVMMAPENEILDGMQLRQQATQWNPSPIFA